MAFSRKTVEFIAIIAIGVVCNVQAARIGISYCSDVGGQMESFKDDTHGSSNAPVECVTDQKTCIGGFSSVVHWLHNTSFPGFDGVPAANILRLSSGNLIGGESGWISSAENGWIDYATLVKTYIQPSALALGMKDFGAGLKQTTTYMKTIGQENFTLVNTCADWANYDKNGTEYAFCSITAPIKMFNTILKADNTTYMPIGIIGFVTPTVERLSLPGKLNFVNVATKIRQTISEASSEIKTFIAVGDGTRAIARQIIDAAPKVKLVIFGSGFSNTNSTPTNFLEQYKGAYIATAGKWGSSVGKLVLDINENSGDIKEVVSKHLKTTVYPDIMEGLTKQASDAVGQWRAKVQVLKQKPIGHSRFDLVGGERCWRNECNLGNLMTDAVVHCALIKYREDRDKPFPYPMHSVWHGGAFFEDTVKGGAQISEFDVHKWLPYHNNVHLVKVQGQHLRSIFQISASGINPEKAGAKDWRQFLQISNGVEVYYETPSGVPKFVRVRIVHDDSGVPRLVDMQDDKDYYLAIPTYLYEGRGVYENVTQYWKKIDSSNMTGSAGFDDDCLLGYIRALDQVSIGIEERIWINGGTGGGRPPVVPDDNKPCETKGSKTAVTVILTIVFFSIFLAIIYVGYFYVLPRLRRGKMDYPANQL